MDGLDIEQTAAHIRQNWDGIRKHLLAGTYRPQPVRRVEIPKANGGTRKLGADGTGPANPATSPGYPIPADPRQNYL